MCGKICPFSSCIRTVECVTWSSSSKMEIYIKSMLKWMLKITIKISRPCQGFSKVKNGLLIIYLLFKLSVNYLAGQPNIITALFWQLIVFHLSFSVFFSWKGIFVFSYVKAVTHQTKRKPEATETDCCVTSRRLPLDQKVTLGHNSLY